MASAAKKPVGIFELITTPAKRDKDRKLLAEILLDDAMTRILADRDAALRFSAEHLDIRPILRALATADAAMIAKIMAVITPAAGSIITVGTERFAYVTGIGYVLIHATRDSIVYTDGAEETPSMFPSSSVLKHGALTMMGIEIAGDARITRANTTGISFRRDGRLIHVNIKPYGEHHRIHSIAVTPLETIPDSLVKFEVPTEMFYDTAANMTDMNLYGITKQMYHTYNGDGTVTTKVVTGTMIKIIEHNGATRTYQQLHDDVTYENGIYSLTTPNGPLRLDVDNTLVGGLRGILRVKGDVYKFLWLSNMRKFRSRGVGTERTFEEII